MPPKYNKDEIDAMVQRAVAAAVEPASIQLAADLTARFDDKYEKVIAECDRLKDENYLLKEKIQKMEESLSDDIKSKLTEQRQKTLEMSVLVKNMEKKIQDCLAWSNRNEQYSRRYNLKIIGLKKKKDEDTRLSVCNMFKDKLGLSIQTADIEAAHILPSNKARQTEDPPNIIVQFTKRDSRNEVIQRRRQLKDTGIVILEDLTVQNVQLMNRVKNHSKIKNSWSSNGKIFGVTYQDKKIHFQLYDDINEKINMA